MSIIYYLKEFFSIFTSPLLIALFLILVSIYFIINGKTKHTSILMSFIFLILLLFSYAPISNLISKPLELKYQSLKIIPKDVKYIVLLGGEFNTRVYEVINIYKKSEGLKIILFGKDSSYNFLEAKDQYNILLNMGVQKADVIVNSKPLNTRQEIIAIKSMLDKQKFILVTNALHMPRAIMLCNYHNLSVIPSPTNYYTKFNHKILSLPSGKNLHQSTKAIHEYLGIVYEKILMFIQSV